MLDPAEEVWEGRIEAGGREREWERERESEREREREWEWGKNWGRRKREWVSEREREGEWGREGERREERERVKGCVWISMYTDTQTHRHTDTHTKTNDKRRRCTHIDTQTPTRKPTIKRRRRKDRWFEDIHGWRQRKKKNKQQVDPTKSRSGAYNRISKKKKINNKRTQQRVEARRTVESARPCHTPIWFRESRENLPREGEWRARKRV